MADLVGIKALLSITSGTNDHLYLGVQGSGGGAEFALRPFVISGQSTAPQRHTSGHSGIALYWLGQVPNSPAQSMDEDLLPFHSRPGERNSPDRYSIDVDKIHTVYLRKQGSRSRDDDDAVRVTNIEVFLYDRDGGGGSFGGGSYWFQRNHNGLWLANEYGHQIGLIQI